jgi:hypothetical protein
MRAKKGAGRSSRERGLRCPACGHRLKESRPTACPLCGFTFRDNRVTGADVSPYAKAYTHGSGGWRLMCEWVWLAGTQRLKHLALMRASMASRRFARINIALLTIGLAVFQLTQVGWHRVTVAESRNPATPANPRGQGWLHVASAPRPLRLDTPPQEEVDLWWSLPQAALAVVTAIPAAALLTWVVLILIRAGITQAYKPRYRMEGRMAAALHYSTAWAVPLTVAGLVTGFFCLSHAAAIARWTWVPPQTGFVLAAAAVGGFSVAMWWFWLVRLAYTAPLKSRGRVAAFVGLVAPLIVIAAAAAWYFGLQLLHQELSKALRLMF